MSQSLDHACRRLSRKSLILEGGCVGPQSVFLAGGGLGVLSCDLAVFSQDVGRIVLADCLGCACAVILCPFVFGLAQSWPVAGMASVFV